MEEFKKIIKPNLKINNVVQPIKTVTIPTYNDLAKATLSKDKYLSEFSTEKDKRRVRENLGIGNNFKVVGEYDTLELLQQNVPVGNEYEAYLVGSEIYTWSDALKKWFRYGAAGNSAYEIAVAQGYTGSEAEWLNSIAKSLIKIINNIDLLEAKLLYTILEENFGKYSIIGTIDGNLYDCEVSKSGSSYIIAFSDSDNFNRICVRKVDDTYTAEWTFILYN